MQTKKKICSKCLIEKDLSDFYFNTNKGQCRSCISIYQINYRLHCKKTKPKNVVHEKIYKDFLEAEIGNIEKEIYDLAVKSRGTVCRISLHKLFIVTDKFLNIK